MTLFEWLEGTAVALWVGESLWGYPILLSLHVVGLAIVVGIFAMRDLRLLGRLNGVSYAALASLVKLGWIGFVINAASGLALFSSQATIFVESTPFLTKISCILLAAITAVFVQKQTRERVAGWDAGDGVPSPQVRVVAAFSLLLWISAIVAGRLIAYM